MRKLALTAALLAATALPATAHLMLAEETFRDLGGTGFGAAPRLLTLQDNVFESGGTQAGAGGTTIIIPNAIAGADKSKVYSVGALGWTSGAAVGIGLDTNEIGATAGLTFQTLTLTLFDAAGNPLASFAGNGPVFITQQQLADQQGNGNSVFDIRLSPDEQSLYNTVLAANGGAFNVFEGLTASFGCTTPAPGCGPSSDGAESFLAFNAVPGPVAGAGLPGLLAAALGLGGLGWHRRWRRRTA